MAQLGKLREVIQDSLGTAKPGVNLTVYREGAIVNGGQSGTSPLAVTVRHTGKIKAGDSIFVNTTTATAYSVSSLTGTTVVNLTWAGGTTLTLVDGDVLVPSNSKPTLYSDDQAAATTSNPLTTDSAGTATCWLEAGAVEMLLSGGGITTKLLHGEVIPTESPAQVRWADNFSANSSTGGIQEALNDLPSAGGKVKLSGGKTYTVSSKITVPSGAHLEGAGKGSTTVKIASGNNIILLENSDTANGNSNITVRGITWDGNNSGITSNTNVLINMNRVSQLTFEDCEIANCRASGLFIQTAVAAKHIWIRGNYVHDTMTNVNVNGHGAIYINGITAAESQIVIANNIVENSGTANSNTGISINGITVNGANATEIVIEGNTVNNSWVNGIYTASGSRVVISNNTVRTSGVSNVANGGNGIFCTAASKVVVTGNIVDGVAANSDNGIEISGVSTDSVCSNNAIFGVANAAKNGIGFGGNARIVCIGNLVSGSTGGGIACKEASGTANNDASFIGNVCIGSVSGSGIDVRGYANVTVSGNTSRSNGLVGIQVGEGITASGSEATNIAITGNVSASNGSEGITVLGEIVAAAGQLARRITVNGNACHANTGDGMRLWDVSGCAIVGNTVSTNGGDGIELGGAAITDIVVDGNLIRDNTSIGLKNGASATTRLVVGPSNLIQGNGTNASAAIGTPTLSGATPGVVGVIRAIATNGGATNVTNLTGGYDGQTITIQHTDGNTTYVDGTNIFLSGSANYNPGATAVLTLTQVAGKWYEVGRSNN